MAKGIVGFEFLSKDVSNVRVSRHVLDIDKVSGGSVAHGYFSDVDVS
jgi:hypothetical protein